jgi:uncharacterized repeat protein (TIGR04138 family)
MIDEALSLARVLKNDERYPLDAYLFVRDALAYAADVLQMGAPTLSEPPLELEGTRPRHPERHLSGQQLCEAIRQYALCQYGYMARMVLAAWGITNTQDFGNIVYNMIAVGLMKKSPRDRRSDFQSVFDFATAFENDFCIDKVASPPPR